MDRFVEKSMERSMEFSLERSPLSSSPSSSRANLSESSSEAFPKTRSVRQSAKSATSAKIFEFPQDSPQDKKDTVSRVLRFEDDLGTPTKTKQRLHDSYPSIGKVLNIGRKSAIIAWTAACFILLFYLTSDFGPRISENTYIPIQGRISSDSERKSPLSNRSSIEFNGISSVQRSEESTTLGKNKLPSNPGNKPIFQNSRLPKTAVNNSMPSDNKNVHNESWSKELSCDTSHWNTDVCFLEGDVRFLPSTMTAVVYTSRKTNTEPRRVKTKPYPFKHSEEVMAAVQEVTLIELSSSEDTEAAMPAKKRSSSRAASEAEQRYKAMVSTRMAPQENHFQLLRRQRRVLEKAGIRKPKSAAISHNGTFQPPSHCEVHHSVPGVVFSVGGYTGNPYHEWQNGILPLWITSQQLQGNVSLVLLQSSDWWVSKYMRVLRILSGFPLVLPAEDPLVHCFPQLTVGLRFHEEMAVNPALMPAGETILHFQRAMKRALGPRKGTLPRSPEGRFTGCRPVLLFMRRSATRVLANELAVLEAAWKVGFTVRVFEPAHATLLEDIWGVVRPVDLLFGVHGAALTHFLFMRPGAAYVQVVPFGVERVAHEFLGAPAVKLGLRYIEYSIDRNESSLSTAYAATDRVFTDADRLFRGGSSGIYLKSQNITLSVRKVRRTFQRAMEALRESGSFRKQRKAAAANPICAEFTSLNIFEFR